jgi:hypothetical protein
MAIVAASPAFRANIQLVASNGKTMGINLSLVATTYADAVTAVTAFLTDLAGVSAGVVKGYSISSQAVNDAVVLPTSDDAEYGERALITGTMEGNPLKPWTLYIPMPLIGIFAGTGVLRDTVDINDAALQAYLANFTVEGDVASVSDGEFIDIILSGRRVN